MNLKNRAVAYGIAGVALAGIMIFAGTNLGVIAPGSSGVLSVLLTDPATVPNGVTAVYITYDNLGLHVAGGGENGWFALNGEGTLDTLGLVNLSQTISSANVPAFNYDKIAFEISSAKVQFNGVNYSATVNGGRLVAQIPGGLRIRTSGITAVIMDIQPTVLNLGDTGIPHLVITALAKALQVPANEVTSSMAVPQSKYSLANRAWTHPLTGPHSDNITLSQVALTANSFSFVASNRGSEPVELKLVVVAPASGGTATMAPSLADSFVFVAEPDGSLQLLHTNELTQSMATNAGYTLQPGASVHFAYSGAITSVFHQIGVSSSTTYNVFAVGQGVPELSVLSG